MFNNIYIILILLVYYIQIIIYYIVYIFITYLPQQNNLLNRYSINTIAYYIDNIYIS